MTHDFVGWTPPPGVEVVDPPVHPETIVSVIYSDRDEGQDPARDLNWSAVGDGPRVVAYAVVQEYKPEPVSREVVAWALVDMRGRTCPYAEQRDAIQAQMLHGGTVVRLSGVMP